MHAIEHAELALLRASIALARRRLDAALEDAEYAKGLQQPLPEADLVIGEVYFRRGLLDAAEAAYARAMEPRDLAAALAGLGAVALRRGDFEQAVDRCLAALERDMGLWRAHVRLGYALCHLGRWPEARLALETATRLNPAALGLYKQRVLIAQALDDQEAAFEYQRLARDGLAKRRLSRVRS